MRNFPGSSDGKESACNAGDPGSIPESGRSPGEGNDHQLQYSCLENSKDRGTRYQIANIRWIKKKQKNFWKTSTSALLTTPKPLTVWITINCGKFWKRWEYQTTWFSSWEICMRVKKKHGHGHGTTNWFQIGKGVQQDCVLSPCLFNLYAEYIMRNVGLDEAQAETKIARR